MTTFANASGSGELLPDGTDSGVLAFRPSTAQGGFLVDPNVARPDHNYTMVFDIDVAAARYGGYMALFQTDTTNTSDAEYFIKKADRASASHQQRLRRRGLAGRLAPRRGDGLGQRQRHVVDVEVHRRAARR